MSMDLLYLARDHDLPPKWDGHAVAWEGWANTESIHLCGRGARGFEREVCEFCGSVAEPVTNTGRYHLRDRHGIERGRKLRAYRCPDCRHDRVRDYDGVWWDLGPEDYGDDGSRAVR